MASRYDFQPQRGVGDDDEGPAAYQAVWCGRTAAFRASYAAAGDAGSATTNRSRTTALRRRLLLLRQPRPPTRPAADVAGAHVPHGTVGQYVQQDLDAEGSTYAYTWRPIQTSEQHYRNREAMLRQYQTWNGIDIKKMDLPFYPETQLHSKVSKVFRRNGTWMVEDQAARQLSHHARRGPSVSNLGFLLQPRVPTNTGIGSLSRPMTRDRDDGVKLPVSYGQSPHAADAVVGSGAAAPTAAAESVAEHCTGSSTPTLQSRDEDGSPAVDSFAAAPPSPLPAAAADGARGSAGRTKSVRFSDELTVHEPARRRAAGLPRTRAMTAVLLSERLPVTASGGRVDYVDKLRKKSSRQFLQALDRVIARLKKTKLSGRGALAAAATADADAAAAAAATSQRAS